MERPYSIRRGQVRIGEGDWAIFDDVGSVPTTMTASRILLACKMLCLELIICQSDYESAYVQASLPAEDVTYVYLPREWWPDHWFHDPATKTKPKYVDPVCPLDLALYGHPQAGAYWERHCDKCVKSVGFTPVESWPSCYILRKYKLFLCIYVDDFFGKSSPPKE